MVERHWQGKTAVLLGENPVQFPLSPPLFSHALTWDWTGTCALSGRDSFSEPWQGVLKAKFDIHYNRGSIRTAQKIMCFHCKELSVLYRETATVIERFCRICKCSASTKCKLSSVDFGVVYANHWALKYCGNVSEFSWEVNRRNVWTAGVSAAEIVGSRMRWEVDQGGVSVVAGIFMAAFIAKTVCGVGWGHHETSFGTVWIQFIEYCHFSSLPGRYAVFQVA